MPETFENTVQDGGAVGQLLPEQDMNEGANHGWDHADIDMGNEHVDSPGGGESQGIGIKEDG